MIDYHNHTKLCKHAEGEVYQYAEQAIKSGITEMAFTDHMPLPDNFDIEHRMAESEMETYFNWIAKAREQYPEIKILFGIEADYYEGFETYTEQFLKRYDFDLVIMSIHFLKGWPEGSWVFNYDFPERSYKDIFTEYLNTIIKGIKCGLYDVIGHLDIIKKPGISLQNHAPEKLHQVLQEIKKNDMTLEINSSGLRKKVNEPYPSFDMLKMIKQHEVDICVGSDSHAPDQVAFKLAEIYSTLNKSNFINLTHFDQRQKVIKPIKNIKNHE